jgi:two-component system, cell cycle response regulator
VNRSPTPHPPPATPAAESTSAKLALPTSTTGSEDLPAYDEFAQAGSTDVLPAVPPEVWAQPGTQRQYIVRVLSGPQTGLSRMLDKEEIVVGRGTACDIMLADSALSRRHCRIVRTPEGPTIEDLGSSNGTFLDGEPLTTPQPLLEGSRVQVGRHTVLGIALQDMLEHSASRQLYEYSMRDPLTGIHNRRYFDQRINEEFSYALRHHTPVSVLIVDLDYFKRINDTWGHPTGDRVLRHASEIIQRCVRKEDVAARFGGEEFAMLCRIQVPEGALALGERVRRRIERGSVAQDGQLIRFTASVGIASAFPDRGYDSVAALLGAADRALYKAKAGGRNRCVDDRQG